MGTLGITGGSTGGGTTVASGGTTVAIGGTTVTAGGTTVTAGGTTVAAGGTTSVCSCRCAFCPRPQATSGRSKSDQSTKEEGTFITCFGRESWFPKHHDPNTEVDDLI